jgi:hypothetical protein
MFHTLDKIVSKHPKRKNVSFLPFPVLMNTQPTNTTQKLCKRIMPFYISTPKTPIPNSPAPSLPPLHMFMTYNHFYCWLCSQNLPLIMLWDHEFGENYPCPFSFTLVSEHKKQHFYFFFPSKNWTHQFHRRHSTISSWLCNKTFRAILLTIV